MTLFPLENQSFPIEPPATGINRTVALHQSGKMDVQYATATLLGIKAELTQARILDQSELHSKLQQVVDWMQTLPSASSMPEAQPGQYPIQTMRQQVTAIALLSQQSHWEAEQIDSKLKQVQSLLEAHSSNSSQPIPLQIQPVQIQPVQAAIHQANQVIEQGDGVMHTTLAGIVNLREATLQITRKMKRLGESAQEISRAFSLSHQFTAQMQLLALNADIDGTRGGEYGRSSAVLVDKVRSLAQQAAAVTTEIGQLVQDVQTETSAVSMAIDSTIPQVVQSTHAINEMHQHWATMVQATHQLRQLLQGMVQSNEAHRQEVADLIQTLQQVTAIAHPSSTATTQMRATMKDLLDTVQALQATIHSSNLR